MQPISELSNKEVHQKFYKESIKKYSPYDVRSLHWNSRQSQTGRFNSLYRIGDLNNRSILDIGCGTGDFYMFLKKKGNKGIEFYGLDFMQDFIEVAREKYPDAQFTYGDFFECRFEKEFDYVFCNGAFNVKVQNNLLIIENVLRKVFPLFKQGFAMTFLKFARGYLDDGKLYYYKEKEIASLLNQFTTNYKIYSDYADNDFTVFVYKQKQNNSLK